MKDDDATLRNSGNVLVRYQPQAFTILATYRCTAMCTNCCFDSNPWLKERLSIDDIIELLDEAAELPALELVGFSGGECFLLGDDLNTAVAHAKSIGLRTRCVTNAYWAKSKEAGRIRLEGLRAAGLDELNISTGDFHQEYVDESAVVNAAELGVEIGFDETLVVVEMQRTRTVSADTLRNNPRVKNLLDSLKFKIIESPWMPINADEFIDHQPNHLLNRSNLSSRHGCRSIFTTMV